MTDALTYPTFTDELILTVQRLLAAGGPFDTACFHSQQAAEKLLKALLAFFGQAIPRTHNLEDINQTCEIVVPGWSGG